VKTRNTQHRNDSLAAQKQARQESERALVRSGQLTQTDLNAFPVGLFKNAIVEFRARAS